MCRAYVDGLVYIVEQHYGTGTTNLSTSYNGLVVPPTSDDVVAVRILANNLIEIYSGASVAGAFPAVHDLKLSAVAQMVNFNAVGGYQQAYPGVPAAQSNALQWAFMFACSASTDTSGTSDLLIKKLQVLGR